MSAWACKTSTVNMGQQEPQGMENGVGNYGNHCNFEYLALLSPQMAQAVADVGDGGDALTRAGRFAGPRAPGRCRGCAWEISITTTPRYRAASRVKFQK